ncbi:MAG: 1-deoxy-D-xylulose-5-phosphate synthase [bacterium]
MSLLEQINYPSDLKKLDKSQLPQLADEIRQLIIETISKTGGHLASSLGTVELTIALHYVFKTPEDKIVWDVGHQTCAHKILTGRKDNIHTLRQYKGLSGFPKHEESPYDVFDTGHSSTSISAALGIREAKFRQNKEDQVIAVIGDGAMTGGLAFEGLNNAGHLKRNLIVILNDNEMSISPNVGALSAYLNRIITGHLYIKMKADIEFIVRSIPAFGNQMLKALSRLEDALKGLVVPGIMFEELGFKYVGPIRGHNMDDLIDTLEGVKQIKRPVLMHVITKKGKGYPVAEADPSSFHSAPPFDITSGIFSKKLDIPTYTSVFSKTLVRIAEEDKRVIAITAAMPEGTGLKEFRDRFPDRFYDVGIAEQHAVTFAAGLAIEGMIPVVAVYSTFLQRSYDQILHDVCLQNLHVVFALDRAGIVGDDGPTHNGVFDISYLRHIPNLIIMAPKDENELQYMLKKAITLKCPVAIRYPRGFGVGVELDKDFISITEKAEILKTGDDVVLIAIGRMVYSALDAANYLEKDGVKAGVINARFIKPLDASLILKVAKDIKKIVTLEENNLPGGFGSAILELLEEKRLYHVKVKRIGLPDKFIGHGSQEIIRHKYGLDSKGIVRVVKKFLSSFN